jgi:hypothetical protein
VQYAVPVCMPVRQSWGQGHHNGQRGSGPTSDERSEALVLLVCVSLRSETTSHGAAVGASSMDHGFPCYRYLRLSASRIARPPATSFHCHSSSRLPSPSSSPSHPLHLAAPHPSSPVSSQPPGPPASQYVSAPPRVSPVCLFRTAQPPGTSPAAH